MKSDEIRAALRAFMAARGLNPSAWSLKATNNRSTLRMFLDGKAKTITMDLLDKLATSEGATIFDIIGSGPRRPSGMVAVPFLTWRTELDGRVVIAEDKKRAPMLMPRSWLEDHAFGEKGRVFMWQMKVPYDFGRVGDIVAIDLRSNNPRRAPGNYAVANEGSLMVRRLNPLAGEMLRMFAEGAPFDISASQIQVVGRAIWRAGDI